MIVTYPEVYCVGVSLEGFGGEGDRRGYVGVEAVVLASEVVVFWVMWVSIGDISTFSLDMMVYESVNI